MRRHLLLILICLVILSHSVCSADDIDDSLSIQFIGEDGKPIPEALFYLFEKKDGKFQKALYRHHKMPDSARISLEEIPKEFTIGVVSSKNFYYKFWNSSDIAIKKGKNVIKVKQTGTVSLTYSDIAPVLRNRALVVPYYLATKTGKYPTKTSGGIGIFGHEGYSFEIEGLEPGKYRIELKKDYESKEILWSKSDVVVRRGRLTKLEELSAESNR